MMRISFLFSAAYVRAEEIAHFVAAEMDRVIHQI